MFQGTLDCPRVSGTVANPGVREPLKYAQCVPLPFAQCWSGGMPREAGTAYIGHDQEGLWLYAWLEDHSIGTRATQNNQKLWELGDTLEWFVKPGRECDDYWEVHVAPNGVVMDIHIPSRDQLMSGSVAWAELIAADSGVRTQVMSCPADGWWAAELCLPWSTFGREAPPPAATEWLFAVCRYNYAEGSDEPELSSTAAFAELSFHRCWEFTPLRW